MPHIKINDYRVKVAPIHAVICFLIRAFTLSWFPYWSRPRNRIAHRSDFILLLKAAGCLLVGWYFIRWPFEFRFIGIFALFQGILLWALTDIWASAIRIWFFVFLASMYWYFHPDLFLPKIFFFIDTGKYFFWIVMGAAFIAAIARLSNRVAWIHGDVLQKKYNIRKPLNLD